VNQNTAFLPTSPLLQPLFNPASTSLEFPQQVLILNIINIDIEMFILVPVFKVLEIISKDGDNMGDAYAFKCTFPAQGEYSRRALAIALDKMKGKDLK
jgi:hypothetical protein